MQRQHRQDDSTRVLVLLRNLGFWSCSGNIDKTDSCQVLVLPEILGPWSCSGSIDKTDSPRVLVLLRNPRLLVMQRQHWEEPPSCHRSCTNHRFKPMKNTPIL